MEAHANVLPWLDGLTVHLAIGAPLSGSAAALGAEMKQAAELAVQDRNAAGGICGARVIVTVVNDEGRVEIGESVARQICGNPQIVGVVGHYNSDVTLAAAAVYQASNLAMITPVASNPLLTEQGWANVFRLTNRDESTAEAIARHLHDVLGKRRALIIESSTAYGASMAACFSRAFTDVGGTVLEHRAVSEGERDFAVVVRTMRLDADVVFYGGSFEGASILQALRQAGRTPLFATGDGCWDVHGFLDPAGNAVAAAAGVLVVAASLGAGGDPRAVAVAERYVQQFGPIGNYALNSYDAMRALMLAVEEATRSVGGSPGRDDVVRAMRRITLDSISYRDPLAWDVKGDNLAAMSVLNRAEPGRFVAVAEVGRPHRLVVGLDEALPPPMQMGEPEKGEFTGYEVDLLHELARRLGKDLRFRRAEWSVIVSELNRGAVDIICSAGTITEDRRSEVEFSRPYLPVTLASVTRGEESSTVAAVTRIGVRRGTTAEAYVRRAGSEPVMLSESNDELYQALAAGRIDRVVDDSPIAGHFSQNIPGLAVSDVPGTDAAYAIMMRKNDEVLRTSVNATLDALERDGTLLRLRQYWGLEAERQ